jgi:flagellar biosynthesis anti-sigma factor FlgM
MKIEVNSAAASQLPPDRGAKQVLNSGLAGTQSTTVDRTTFHSDSTSVKALTAQALSSPEVRQDKVDAISESVKSGTYKVDATKIAGAILESEGN